MAHAVAALVACASASWGGEVFPYDLDVMLAKHHILPRMAGKWLLLGCDSIVPTRATDGLDVGFTSGSLRQTAWGEGFESVHVPFAGDINRDGRIDFVIRWTSTYANRHDVLVSRRKRGVWRWEKEAETVFSD